MSAKPRKKAAPKQKPPHPQPERLTPRFIFSFLADFA